LKCALRPEELEKVSDLADNLKGASISESVWNVLAWEDENIDYDWSKALLPNPIIERWDNGALELLWAKITNSKPHTRPSIEERAFVQTIQF